MATAIQPSIKRASGVVAHCAARAGDSVAVEGLFQTAVDHCGSGGGGGDHQNPILRDCLLLYADFIRNRGVDADKLDAKALEVDRSLGAGNGNGCDDDDGWQGKSGLYSGLWFFSIGDF